MHSIPPPPAEEFEQRARRYLQRQKTINQMKMLSLIGVPMLMVPLGVSYAIRELVLIWTGAPVLILTAYVILFWILMSAVAAFSATAAWKTESAFGLTKLTFAGFMKSFLKGRVVFGVLALIAAHILYGAIRSSFEYWWLYTWIGLMMLYVFLIYLGPTIILPMFHTVKRLSNGELQEKLKCLVRKANSNIRRICEWQVGSTTTKANAMLTGLGSSRTIIVTDTLVKNYSHEEIEAIVAHELGHQQHNHLLKRISAQAACSFVGLWLLSLALPFFSVDDLRDVTYLPDLFVAILCIQLYSQVILNRIARKQEVEADQFCCNLIADANSFANALQKLERQNLLSYKKSEEFRYTHPAVSERIALARAHAQQAAKKSTEANASG